MYRMHQTPASFSQLQYQSYPGYPSHYSGQPAAQEQSQRYADASRMPSAAEEFNSSVASRQRMGLLQEAHGSKRHMDAKESALKSSSSSSMRKPAANGRTMTLEQLHCLKKQLYAYKHIARGMRVPPEVLKDLKPPPLHALLLPRDNGKLEAPGLLPQDGRKAQVEYGPGSLKPEYKGAHIGSMYPMTQSAVDQASIKANAQVSFLSPSLSLSLSIYIYIYVCVCVCVCVCMCAC